VLDSRIEQEGRLRRYLIELGSGLRVRIKDMFRVSDRVKDRVSV
jgi:hypothetical protein